MGFILCTSDCKYQHEGSCTLNCIAPSGYKSNSGCIHYIPKREYEYNPIKEDIKTDDSSC